MRTHAPTLIPPLHLPYPHSTPHTTIATASCSFSPRVNITKPMHVTITYKLCSIALFTWALFKQGLLEGSIVILYYINQIIVIYDQMLRISYFLYSRDGTTYITYKKRVWPSPWDRPSASWSIRNDDLGQQLKWP